MIKYVISDHRCTGCGVCEAVCRKQAISMENDAFGFWYPKIDEAKCVECGKCLMKCPVYGEWNAMFMYENPISYAGHNLNAAVRFISSSGGVFSAIVESILERGGVIYGAAYRDDLTVEHIRIADHSDLYKLEGSKYVQSKIRRELYQMLEQDLNEERLVLFSGTPCQTAAVSSYFGKYNNLVTVDVICHGVPSPASWKDYLFETRKYGAVQSVNMREKSHGWNHFHMVISYEDGHKTDTWFNDDPWGKSFVRNLFLRESCYNCEFKEKIRSADISLGDFWEAARGIHTEFDDGDQGTSVILVNSPKGQEIIDSIVNCKLEEIPYEWISDKTYAIARSSHRSPNRERAFRMLKKGLPFSKVVKKCTKTSFSTRVIRKIKWMLGKGKRETIR